MWLKDIIDLHFSPRKSPLTNICISIFKEMFMFSIKTKIVKIGQWICYVKLG